MRRSSPPPGPKRRLAHRRSISPTPASGPLFAERPAVVVDTAGPFQVRDYGLAERCVQAGVHYVDIADGRLYVAGIVALDAAARERDVLVVSGASTVPAITTAVVTDLADPGDDIVGRSNRCWTGNCSCCHAPR